MADQNSIPPNLPTIEDNKPSSLPPPPPSLAVVPKPVSRPFRSFIRTMETDIQAVQAGKAPQGVEKQIPLAPSDPASPAINIPKIIPPTSSPSTPGVQVKLGKIEPNTVDLPSSGGPKISVNAPQVAPKIALPVPKPNTVVVPSVPGTPKLSTPVLPPLSTHQSLPILKPSLIVPPVPAPVVPVSPKPTPTPPTPVTPKLPIVPPAPKLEIKAPIAPPAVSAQHPPSLMPPSSITPPEGEAAPWFKNPRNIIAAVVVLAVLGFGYWFLMVHNADEDVTETATPSSSFTPTATPPISKIRSFFGNVYVLPIARNGAIDKAFLDAEILKLNLDNAGRNILLNPVDEYGTDHTFRGFLDRFLVSFPVNLLSGVDQDDFDLVLSRQQEKFDTKGQLVASDNDNRVALVVRVIDAEQTRSTMLNWEESLVAEMQNLFALSGESRQPTFVAASYRDVAVRYRNFPYPDRSIDYAIVTAVDNDDYLVITNSREQMFNVIDVLLGFGALGK